MLCVVHSKKSFPGDKLYTVHIICMGEKQRKRGEKKEKEHTCTLIEAHMGQCLLYNM